MAFFPEATAQHYAALAAAMADVPIPVGRIFFAAGPTDGGWQVVQAWTSRDALDAFNRTAFFPALARISSGGFPQPPIVVDFETTDLALS